MLVPGAARLRERILSVVGDVPGRLASASSEEVPILRAIEDLHAADLQSLDPSRPLVGPIAPLHVAERRDHACRRPAHRRGVTAQRLKRIGRDAEPIDPRRSERDVAFGRES